MTPRKTSEPQVTHKDLMEMQEKMFEQNQLIYNELTGIKVKVALISGGIATAGFIVSVLASVFIAN